MVRDGVLLAQYNCFLDSNNFLTSSASLLINKTKSDHLPKEIGELSFRQVVLSIKLRKDAIAVALRDRVYVYHLGAFPLSAKET